ncbi:MAG: hypothetical protein Q7S96_03790 [bacterium]|nr:hypothetical protein [bacterium]
MKRWMFPLLALAAGATGCAAHRHEPFDMLATNLATTLGVPSDMVARTLEECRVANGAPASPTSPAETIALIESHKHCIRQHVGTTNQPLALEQLLHAVANHAGIEPSYVTALAQEVVEAHLAYRATLYDGGSQDAIIVQDALRDMILLKMEQIRLHYALPHPAPPNEVHDL